MPTEADPVVGNWYQHLDKGQTFSVVALNEDEGLVEVQHFDGDLEEIDSETWYQLDLEPSEEPENWSGPIDVGEIDDLGTEVTDTTGADWNAPLLELPSTEPIAEEEEEQGEGSADEWGEAGASEEPWADQI
jgi:hypothetical protein